MNTLHFIIVFCIVFAIGIGLLVWIKLQKKTLQGAAKIKIQKAWRHAQGQPNAVLKIMEADKVLDESLRLLGFRGTLGEKLKKAGPRFSELNALWKAHKLRNTLAHTLQTTPSTKEVITAMSAFEYALKELGM